MFKLDVKRSGNGSLHIESDSNRIRLISFAASKYLIFSSTKFKRKEIHKHTWTSPDGRFKSQIDYTLINRRHRNRIRHGSFRGVDGNMDHYLGTVYFKVKLSRVWKKELRKAKK